MAEMLAVEVVLALPGEVIRRELRLPAGACVGDALAAAGLDARAGAISPERLGVFGRRASPAQPLADGDRVEIYRPLELDPKEARRRRARP